jgi:hypothetical protein
MVLLVAGAMALPSLRHAHADDQAVTPRPSTPAPEAANSDPYETRRIVDITLLAAGLAIATTGGYFVIKDNRSIGGCDLQGHCTQEDGRVPLGLGMLMVGGALAVAGGVFWLQIPSTSARVSVAPNGLAVAGNF